MTENIKTIAKIGGKTAFKWFFVFAIGNIVTMITFFTALFRNIELAGEGHGSVISLFIGLLLTNVFAFFLVFGAPVFLFLYFSIASKISIQTAIYLIWKGNAGDYVLSKVENVIKKITEKEGWRKEISNKLVLKAKLAQSLDSEPDMSKVQRKIINYVLTKIDLDKIDFQNEDLNLSDVILEKFNSFISEMAEPSSLFFWLIVACQFLLLITSEIIK